VNKPARGATPRTAIVLLAAYLLPSSAPAQPPGQPVSLKGKSNAELVQLITGATKPLVEKPPYDYDEDRVAPSPLDRLWEMDPRDAAVAFATDYISETARGSVELRIDDRNATPPSSGEVGLRWFSGNHYAAPAEGIKLLKYDRYRSELLLSEVEIEGRPSKEEVEEAVMKTDSHPLRRLVAKQTYEILWWLRHVRPATPMNSISSGSSTSNDDFGRFWIKPDGPVSEQTIISEPCGECIAQGDGTSYQGFADTLIRRLVERSGIKRRYPVPKVGKHFDPDEDARFLHDPPPEGTDSEAVKRWIGRLVDILRNPERQYLYSDVMDMLVPISDPLRYPDERINDALLDVLHRGRAEVLRKEFAELSAADQLAFRQFITWLRTVDVSFSRRYLENTFTPHTPRPDVLLER